MLIRATLYNRSWPVVFRKYVFILNKPLNERSAVQVVAGITANIFMILWRSGRIWIRSAWCNASQISEAVVDAANGLVQITHCIHKTNFKIFLPQPVS